MEKEEKFCLKWNDYSSNLEKSFRELRSDKMLFDITLACDNTQVKAHMVVLSACSNFFKEILRTNTHKHPFLYLRGVKISHLNSLLDFMYNGEVNMGHSELSEFLLVAGDLEVKGLTPDIKDSEEPNPLPPQLNKESRKPEPEINSSPPSSKRKKVVHHQNLVVRHDLVQPCPPPSAKSPKVAPSDMAMVKVEEETYPDESTENPMELLEIPGDEDNLDFNQMSVSDEDGFKFGSNAVSDMYDEHNAKVDLMVRSKMMESAEGWTCAVCVFSGSIRKVYQHVELNHVSVQYYCQLCQKVCKTRNSLFCHRYRYHRNKTHPGSMDEAPSATQQSSLSFSPPNKTISSTSAQSLVTSTHAGLAAVPTNNYILAKIENQ